MCTTYVWCLHNTLLDGQVCQVQEACKKRLLGVVDEQQGNGQQSSSTQELNESNLSNAGLGCQVLRIKALSMMIPELAFF